MKKNRKKAAENLDLEDSIEEKQNTDGKGKKKATLKQFMVSGTCKGKKIIAFFMATCGLKAREAYLERYKDASISSVTQTAISDLDADWLKTNKSFQWEADLNKLKF